LNNWQAHQLPGGRMAVTAALSEKGGWNPDDVQLYISYSSGDGKWSEPVVVKGSRAKKESFNKETGGGNAVGALYQYSGGARGAQIIAPNTKVVDAVGRLIFAPAAGAAKPAAASTTGSRPCRSALCPESCASACRNE